MKQIMNFTRVKNFLSNYTQTILLIIGLILINISILLLVNIGYFLLSTGITLVLLSFIVNYEKNGGEKV